MPLQILLMYLTLELQQCNCIYMFLATTTEFTSTVIVSLWIGGLFLFFPFFYLFTLIFRLAICNIEKNEIGDVILYKKFYFIYLFYEGHRIQITEISVKLLPLAR